MTTEISVMYGSEKVKGFSNITARFLSGIITR